MDAVTNITGTDLDSPLARPTDSHLPVLAQKSAGGETHKTKTNIVVVRLVRVIVVAVRRATPPRIEVPGAAVCLPHI
ncbi:MAG: hypothetical protein O4749_03890 [Trichodesmium sp. St5_bin2_1]|nr:hypothetical protein [Trichodesmium sp. St5_bin2_1]